MSGKIFPNTNVSLFFRFWVFGTALLLHGCLQPPRPVVSPTLSPAPQAQSTLVMEARAEAESLRTTMAAERIKAAKQAANIRMAQNQVSTLRHREIEHVATIAKLKKELSMVNAERDEFQKEITQLRTQTATIPQFLEMVTNVRILETSLKGMVSSIDTLSNETEQLKEQIQKQQTMAARSQRRGSSGLAEGAPHAEDTDSIVVKRGDSLWQLARRYDTTVAALKTLNNLDRDLILVGQVLKIPSPAHLLDEPDLDESLKADNQPNH